MESITRGDSRWWRILSTAAATALVVALVLLVGSAPAATRTTSSARLGAHTGKPTASGGHTGAPTRVGPTDPAQAITITLSLVGQSQADLARTIAGIADPNSPNYHHYLTPDEYTKRFGASAAVQARVEDALRAGGFAVAPHPAGSTLVSASGTIGQAEALFGVRLDNYRDADGTVYFAPKSGPHLPPAMAGVVISVLGLGNRPLVHRAGALKIPQSHPAPQPLGPRQLATAYNIKPLQDAGLDGSGQTIAFAEIDDFKQSDIDRYDQKCGLDSPCTGINAPPVEVVKVRGGADKAKDVSETTLDIEVVHAIAPKTHLIAYEGPAEFDGLTATFNKIVSDNKAQVVSISLGGCEPAIVQAHDLGIPYLNTLNTIFKQAAAQGMTVLVASGDNGAYTCARDDPNDNSPSVSLPADNPYVTAVGGTALFVNNNDGGSYAYEAGWEGPLEGSGGGGGVSVGYPIPSWQSGPGVSNQYSTGMRQIPDVAAAADPLTGYKIYDSTSRCSGNECWTAVGGTSAAAPLWASLVVLANQQAKASGKKTMGFINPALYTMGSAGSVAPPFHDITLGGNLFYQTTSGWDYSTGWGTPDAAVLVKALVDQAPGA